MRILHIYKAYWPVLGGIENHVRVLAEAQAAAGHQVTVLVCGTTLKTRRETLGAVSLLRAGSFVTVRSMPLSLAMLRLAARETADIVHVHSPFPLGEQAALQPARRGAKLIVTHHSDVIKQRLLLRLYAPFYRPFLHAVDRILVTSEAYGGSSPWLRPHQAKCRLAPLGVDGEHFSPLATPAFAANTLLFAGCLRHYKGLNNLIEAMALLPQYKLRILGSGPMSAPWQRLSRERGLSERISFEGTVDDTFLLAAYRNSALFCLPAVNRAEAFGTVLLEAMACGRACVTTELGTGTSWVVQDGVTGRVVPPNAPKELAAAIEAVLSDSQLRARMEQAARQRVEAHFLLEKMVATVMDNYLELLNG